MTLAVRVIPNAKVTRIVSWDGFILVLHLHAPPRDGMANDELIRFLSKQFKIPKTSITIKKGAAAKIKLLDLPDIAPLLSSSNYSTSSTPPAAHG